jgi:hypothetical protein
VWFAVVSPIAGQLPVLVVPDHSFYRHTSKTPLERLRNFYTSWMLRDLSAVVVFVLVRGSSANDAKVGMEVEERLKRTN